MHYKRAKDPKPVSWKKSAIALSTMKQVGVIYNHFSRIESYEISEVS